MIIHDSLTPYTATRYNLETGGAKRATVTLRWHDGSDEICTPGDPQGYTAIVHWFYHPRHWYLVVVATARHLVAVHLEDWLAYCGQKASAAAL